MSLFWAAPPDRRRWSPSFLLVPFSFAVASAVFYSGTSLGIGFPGNDIIKLDDLLALPASGMMAWSVGYVAQSFAGPTTALRVRAARISALTGLCGVALASVGLAVWFSTGLAGAILLLLVFPGLWLGTVTYVCLKLVQALGEPSPETAYLPSW